MYEQRRACFPHGLSLSGHTVQTLALVIAQSGIVGQRPADDFARYEAYLLVAERALRIAEALIGTTNPFEYVLLDAEQRRRSDGKGG